MTEDGNVGYQVTAGVSVNRSVLPPCKVCGTQATGIHYGASTCEACKVRYHIYRGTPQHLLLQCSQMLPPLGCIIGYISQPALKINTTLLFCRMLAWFKNNYVQIYFMTGFYIFSMGCILIFSYFWE